MLSTTASLLSLLASILQLGLQVHNLLLQLGSLVLQTPEPTLINPLYIVFVLAYRVKTSKAEPEAGGKYLMTFMLWLTNLLRRA